MIPAALTVPPVSPTPSLAPAVPPPPPPTPTPTLPPASPTPPSSPSSTLNLVMNREGTLPPSYTQAASVRTGPTGARARSKLIIYPYSADTQADNFLVYVQIGRFDPDPNGCNTMRMYLRMNDRNHYEQLAEADIGEDDIILVIEELA